MTPQRYDDYRPRRTHSAQIVLRTSLRPDELPFRGRLLEHLLLGIACVLVGTALGFACVHAARTIADHLRPFAAVVAAEKQMRR